MDCLVVGIDGLDPGLLEEWREDLPTLSRLIETGSFGRLHSAYPPLSSPAWPTLFTGKQGGKHGVFGFTRERESGHTRVPVNYDDVTAESIWEAFDDAGVSIGVANVPLTYPPASLDNGYVVSGWPVPNRVDVGNPQSVVDTIERELDQRYRVHPFPMEPELKESTPEETREAIVEGMQHHARAFEALLEHHPVDVFFGVFMAIDHASHHLAWDRDQLREAYVAQDAALERVLSHADEDTDVVVLSDHGHGARGDLNFHTNEWLAAEGYLQKTDPTVDSDGVFRSLGVTRENLIALKNRLGIDDVRQLVPQSLFSLVEAAVPPAEETEAGFDPDQIDWSETVAYSGMQNTISLTDDVPVRERADLRAEIAARLAEVDHPRREGGLLTYAHTRDDIFEGPHTEDAPDVVFVTDEMRCKANVGFTDDERVFTDLEWGEHRQRGVLVTAGPSFTTDADPPERDITDVFPMLCSLLGVSAPERIDGDLPVERLAGDASLDHRAETDRDDDTSAYSDEETAAVRDQLEDLGYLE